MGDIALVQNQPDSARSFFEAALRLADGVGAVLEADTLKQRIGLLQPA
jgi:hypothetical protein